ncbi:MAG: hypothetical protein Q9220_000506 [cf. Caloplaca sp. 1 TL-2023]
MTRAYDRIFAAVFPPPSESSVPTPAATPVLGGDGFESSPAAKHVVDLNPKDSAAEQVQWERSWHTATTFLSLPNKPLPPLSDRHVTGLLHGTWWKPHTPEIEAAIRYLVSPQSRGVHLRRHEKTHDILQWYFEEAGLRHFVQYVLPQILQALANENSIQRLLRVVTYIEQAHVIYIHNFEEYVFPLCKDNGIAEKAWLKPNLIGLLIFSLPQARIDDGIGRLLRGHAEGVLGIHSRPSSANDKNILQKASLIVRKLEENGLGGPRIQKILAEVMSEILSAFIKQSFARQWQSPSKVITQLRYWVENRFARYVVEILAISNTEDSPQPNAETEIALADVERWQEIAINRLGALRTEELFDIIIEWESGSKGAIEDLKHYVTTTAARMHLTNSFSETLNRRLLQPGAATTKILQVYISIIRAFTLLDPKGVLLDRVARPIRRYLRDRDDTVAIVVSSLLAESEDTLSGSDTLPELAEEMANISILENQEDDDADLDFDDMRWMPDPVDAGPDYKRSKHLDVIGSLISLFESKDVFVKEFQQILGERLLRKEQDFDKETRVLELLKFRFGEASLQACEVMLRDVLDSRRVDAVIRKDQNLAAGTTSRDLQTDLHTRILSHLFWPSLHSESFTLPREISSLQSRYESGFETLKQSRKLTWLNALGQVTVHLELEDRTVTETVQTWQAVIIYAFQNDNDNLEHMVDDSDDDERGNGAVPTKSVSELMTQFSMSESFVRNALTFWVGKLVLRPSPTAPDTYYVLESLPQSVLRPGEGGNRSASSATLLTAAAAADIATSAPAPAVRSEEEIAREKMEVFWQFVLGMLTNQGAMPLTRIVMMLKVVVPGGFPFGNEELKSFLEGRVREGKLEVAGGVYKIAS